MSNEITSNKIRSDRVSKGLVLKHSITIAYSLLIYDQRFERSKSCRSVGRITHITNPINRRPLSMVYGRGLLAGSNGREKGGGINYLNHSLPRDH